MRTSAGLQGLLGLDDHPARPAAGVKNAARVRRRHLDQHMNHAARSVELSAPLPPGARDLRKKPVADTAEDVSRPVLPVAETRWFR